MPDDTVEMTSGTRKRLGRSRKWRVDTIREFVELYDPARSGEDFYMPHLHLECYGRVRNEMIIVARVEVAERWRRRGHFKAFIHEVEAEADQRGWSVVFEAVMNPILGAFLESDGYSRIGRDSWIKGAGAEEAIRNNPPESPESLESLKSLPELVAGWRAARSGFLVASPGHSGLAKELGRAVRAAIPS